MQRMISEKEAKKRNFTQCETEVLVGEVETRKNILFAASSEGRVLSEIQEKWSDIKVKAKRCIVLVPRARARGHWSSTLLMRFAAIIGESLLSWVVTEGDTDLSNDRDNTLDYGLISA